MTTLTAVVAAWEATTGKHSWRNPTAWDARVLGALVEWGYQPSEVERILLGEEPQPSTETDGDDNADEASDSAAWSAPLPHLGRFFLWKTALGGIETIESAQLV
jgi:ParB family transcriptional regulator, chromosome partitioning protein